MKHLITIVLYRDNMMVDQAVTSTKGIVMTMRIQPADVFLQTRITNVRGNG